jgi:hypothetical protein
MLSKQIDQAERRETLINDKRVRDQQQEQSGRTFHAHALAEASTPMGRFTAVTASTVVGAQPITNYPGAAAAHQIQLPDEPPLSAFDNPAFDPGRDALPSAQALPNPASAPTGDVECAGLGLSPENMVAQRMSQMASSSARGGDVRAERPPPLRRRRL